MIPLTDSAPTSRFPIVNWILIVINVVVFIYELTASQEVQANFINTYALIPALVHVHQFSSFIPFVTAAFLHAGWSHIIFNMLFLYVFGDNVEDALGWKYLPFYLAGGVIGNIVQYLTGPESVVPVLGASGAIAAVLGAYWLLYPRNTVKTLIFLLFFITIINLPASYLLLFWFLTQLFNGATSLFGSSSGSGVAYFAHIGGFLSGIVLAYFLAPSALKNRRDVSKI